MIGPVHSARLEIFGHGLERFEELALLDGERADREVDGSFVLQQQQRLQHGKGVLASGKRNRHAVAFADHFEAGDSLTHFAQDGLFDVQAPIIALTNAKRFRAATVMERTTTFYKSLKPGDQTKPLRFALGEIHRHGGLVDGPSTAAP